MKLRQLLYLICASALGFLLFSTLPVSAHLGLGSTMTTNPAADSLHQLLP